MSEQTPVQAGWYLCETEVAKYALWWEGDWFNNQTTKSKFVTPVLRFQGPLVVLEPSATARERATNLLATLERKKTNPYSILLEEVIHAITQAEQQAREPLLAQIEKLQKFKDWVHNYLDTHGVPHHPPGTHGAAGCRIGDRMDWLMEQKDSAFQRGLNDATTKFWGELSIAEAYQRGKEEGRREERGRIIIPVREAVEKIKQERTDNSPPQPAPPKKKYTPWSEAGGPNECKHGYAAGIPCPHCDAESGPEPAVPVEVQVAYHQEYIKALEARVRALEESR